MHLSHGEKKQTKKGRGIKGGYSQRNQSPALPIPLFICELNSVKVLQQPCMTDERTLLERF